MPKKSAMTEPIWNEIDERLKSEIAARKPSKTLVARAEKIADILAQEFPEADCALDYTTPWELLMATILSAQCTDVRVNMVTPELRKKYKSLKAYAEAPEGELEKDIHSTGFYNNKAKAIRETARILLEKFNGEVPRDMEGLLQLRGAARKTANVVRMHAFRLPGIAVDTHYGRITQRLGLTNETDPEKIEFDTAALLPPERWTKFADSVILHGRKTCAARSPKCEECALAALCPSAGKVVTEPPAKKSKKG